MFRTDQTTAVTALPVPAAAGTPGYFTGGNPATGQAATILDADWLNMVQEELMNLLAAAGIPPSKTTYNQVLAAIQKVVTGQTSGRLLNVQKFTSSGTYTPTPGTTSIVVEVLGGGGGGGGSAATSSTQAAVGGCGASGAYAKSRFTTGFAAGIAVTVGAAGVAGAAGSVGGTGGTTYFGSLVAAPGGTGGGGGIALAVSGGTGSGVCSAPNPPGNLVSYPGSSVMQSIIISSGVAFTAAGGSSMYGSGGIPSGVTGAGFSGSGYGAAGSGGVSLASAAAQVGGAGSQGVAIVWEYA
ncbi:hypothetical protein BLA6993_03586 [Burkholderia lata]|uniref:phage tail protein n=1 Tax=Burkholderia lata (strain ATCC 17760 / DSM 23089 / LMG 22485 / NCIMB 9086 / R18194 / 383) TaxID=482957 RepID=UPI00145406E4|nr:phage tail protein [Burkholderia lata]VWB75897.1 hypothetical protein BLA6993_03586 [Burkholderia lata]